MSSFRILKPNRLISPRISRVLLTNSFIKVTLVLEGRMSHRQRRAISLVIIRSLSPVLKRLLRISILAQDGLAPTCLAEDPPISMRSACNPTERGLLGCEIRLRRLQIGLTQAELASLAGICAPQLSWIERGKARARASTLRRLLAALASAQPGEIDPFRLVRENRNPKKTLKTWSSREIQRDWETLERGWNKKGTGPEMGPPPRDSG
jgi:transcriptional regulator with XRE-family HTH domain